MFFDQNPIITPDNYRQMDLNMRNDHLYCHDQRFSSPTWNEPFQNQTFRCHRCGSSAGSSCNCWREDIFKPTLPKLDFELPLVKPFVFQPEPIIKPLWERDNLIEPLFGYREKKRSPFDLY